MATGIQWTFNVPKGVVSSQALARAYYEHFAKTARFFQDTELTPPPSWWERMAAWWYAWCPRLHFGSCVERCRRDGWECR